MDNKVVLIILAILLPPLAVFMKNGPGKDLAINVLLCLVCWFSRIIHSVWLVTK